MIEGREIDDWTPRPRGFPDHEQTAVKTEREKRNKLHRTRGNQIQGNLLERNPLVDEGLYEGIGMDPQVVEDSGKGCGNPPAVPPQPTDLRPCPSRPANGGTDSRRTGSGKVMAPTSENPKVWKEEPTPYRP